MAWVVSLRTQCPHDVGCVTEDTVSTWRGLCHWGYSRSFTFANPKYISLSQLACATLEYSIILIHLARFLWWNSSCSAQTCSLIIIVSIFLNLRMQWNMSDKKIIYKVSCLRIIIYYLIENTSVRNSLPRTTDIYGIAIHVSVSDVDRNSTKENWYLTLSSVIYIYGRISKIYFWGII